MHAILDINLIVVLASC